MAASAGSSRICLASPNIMNPTTSSLGIPGTHRRTLTACGICAGVFVCLMFSVVSAEEMRTWTSADGERTFMGQLQGYNPDAGEVTVTRQNGQSITFNQSVLSEADIAYLAEQGAVDAPPTAPAAANAAPPAGGGGLNPDAIGFGLEGYDGREADMTKPVKVFILLGQSNMLGFGRISGGDGSLEHAVKEKGLYPYLVDDQGEWITRKDVRNVRVMNDDMRVFNNEWMTITDSNIGPEIGIGHFLGNALEEPVMILKSCIGNRSLGWDLLPPGSESYTFDGKVYPGYGETEATAGTGQRGEGWYAGKQWDTDIGNVKRVLENLDTFYPEANGYEVVGFFWWQGDKDMRNNAHASRYELNLVHLINTLRETFDAPNAKFVCATLGQTQEGAGGGQGKLLEAKMAVDGESGKYPGFKGNVATVYTHPLSKGGSSSSHYGNNAETYMNVGEAMGEAMVELLIGK